MIVVDVLLGVVRPCCFVWFVVVCRSVFVVCCWLCVVCDVLLFVMVIVCLLLFVVCSGVLFAVVRCFVC